MGSTGTHIDRGQKMLDVALSDYWPGRTILKHGTRRTSGEWQYAAYVAVRNDETGEVFALVVLMHRNPSPHVYWNFHYKFVSEDMGPFEDDCPADVFALLTPTESEYANEWRGRVRLNLERPKPAALKVGALVRFPFELSFSDGVKCTDFTFVRRTTFRRSDQTLVRIPSWRARGGEVVAA